LKSWDARGFVFFTRYSTHKADDLLHERRTSLLFYWRELDRQVRIEGEATRIDRQDSETYFATRPRESQLAARAASGQRRIVGATWLRERFEQEAATFAGKPVAMPDDWGGYRVVARRFEFWQGRPDRMHDRIVYEPDQDGAWSTHRLAP
jgi:pyridoxamine-phosphate oxidase